MNVTDFIKHSLEMSKARTGGLIDDMRDAPLATPTSVGGNHPLWILGHLVYSESALLDQAILGRKNRYADWRELFGAKSTPLPEADRYPSMDVLFAKWDEVRSDVIGHVDSLTDDDLDQRSHAPENYGPSFATVGACLNMIIMHPQFHAGQVADARRATGKDPLFL